MTQFREKTKTAEFILPYWSPVGFHIQDVQEFIGRIFRIVRPESFPKFPSSEISFPRLGWSQWCRLHLLTRLKNVGPFWFYNFSICSWENPKNIHFFDFGISFWTAVFFPKKIPGTVWKYVFDKSHNFRNTNSWNCLKCADRTIPKIRKIRKDADRTIPRLIKFLRFPNNIFKVAWFFSTLA